MLDFADQLTNLLAGFSFEFVQSVLGFVEVLASFRTEQMVTGALELSQLACV